MDLTIFDIGEQDSSDPMRRDAASLYQVFEKVKDGRKRKGWRYPLALLLTLLLLGKMAGETEREGIIDWIDEREKELKKLLRWPKRFPVNSTYTSALSKCDGQLRIDYIIGVMSHSEKISLRSVLLVPQKS